MGIIVETTELRFKVTPDYNNQQLNQMRDDMKNSEKEIRKTQKAIEANSEAYRKLSDEIIEVKKQQNRLASKRSRTKEEDESLGR